jgi:hypothetical protein
VVEVGQTHLEHLDLEEMVEEEPVEVPEQTMVTTQP